MLSLACLFTYHFLMQAQVWANIFLIAGVSCEIASIMYFNKNYEYHDLIGCILAASDLSQVILHLSFVCHSMHA